MYKSPSQISRVFVGMLVLVSSFSYALDDTQIIDRETTTASDISLKSFTSCDEMDTVLSKYFKKALQDQIDQYGKNTYVPMPVDDITGITPSVVANPEKGAMGIGGGGGSGVVFSQTNVQIDGIDEADVVKTDGKYIYYASNQPDADGYQYVTITRAAPATTMDLVKRIKLPNNYSNIQLYLSGGRLVIMANRWNQNYLYGSSPIMFGGSGTSVVAVYDVTDPANPHLERFYSVNGDLSQSRRNGDYLYVLSQNSVSFNPWGPIGVYSTADIDKYMETFDAQGVLPKALDVRYSTASTTDPYTVSRSSVKCQEVEYLLPEKPQNLSFTTLSIIPLKTKAEVTRKVIYGDASQIFMSQNSLYIVSNYWKQGGNFSCPPNARCLMPSFRNEQNSLVHKFALKSSRAQYTYSVLMPGMPLSQYAMDEKDGVFYTANQKDWTSNGVDIFAIDASGKLLSKLENVGAKERFQAARYIGDRLYLVTFLQVDPLFVIDRSDASKLSILGELTMPGYSMYLHPYDETHLIGLGYDTKTSQWGGTVNGGLKVDLYDVADVAHPKQQYSTIFGGMGSSADALWNPRALIWDAAHKRLLFSAQLMDQNPVTYQYTSAWQGLLSIKVDANSDVTQEGKITHIDMSDIAAKRKADCAQYSKPVITEEKCYTHITTGEKICVKPSDNPQNQQIPAYCYAEMDDSSYLGQNIWNYYNNFVQRGVYIGDTLYSLSPAMIQANTYGGNYGFIKKVPFISK